MWYLGNKLAVQHNKFTITEVCMEPVSQENSE